MSSCYSSLFAGPRCRSKVIALFSLTFVFLFPQPGRAQEPLKFFKNYFVTGSHLVRGVSLWRKGINGKATVNIPALGGTEGVPATADILAAFLYVQTAEKIRGSGIDGARFDGINLGPFTAAGSVEPGSGTFAKALVDWDAAPAPCWIAAASGARKVQTYRVDVLRFLPIDPVTGKQSLTKPHQLVVPDAGTLFDDDNETNREKDKPTNLPRAIGASLVVIYRDAAKPYSGTVIYDGAYKKAANATMQQTIKGFYQASTNPSARMTHIVGDGRSFLSEIVYLGPTPIATNPFVSSLGPKWDNTTFPNALAPTLPLLGGADQAVVKVGPNTSQSDCLTYSAIVFSTRVQDTDADGLLDIWEQSESLLDPHGQPLPNLKEMGANPNQKDLFVEIGYMYICPPAPHPCQPNEPINPVGTPGVKYGDVLKPYHTHLPKAEALQMVAEAFRYAPVSNGPGIPTGINVHFDVGNNYQPASIPSAESCANPETWTFACAIVPAGVARGGEAIDEMFTICNPSLLTSVDPWVCQFSDHLVGGVHTGGHPGTVGWKSGYRFLRDRIIAATPPPNIEECNAPGNDGPGDPCERQFDDNRKHMFHYLFSAHSVGIPQDACLNPDGSVNDTCQETSLEFHAPKTYSAIADFPGGDVLLTLGSFNDAAGHPVGTPYMQGATIMHEWGHNFELKHGGPANPKVGGAIVRQIPREPNCKPNYLSVMNYLFQLRGLPDADGVLRMDYSREAMPLLNESELPENLPIGSQLYRTGWYAPFTQTPNAKAATKHCDGSDLTPAEQEARDNGGGMMRVDATSVLGNIDWNVDGDIFGSPSQDINFNGVLDTQLKGSTEQTSDWPNIRLQELAARRNVGGLYIDTLGRLAVGPMSLYVGQGDIGQGDIGQGDIGQGDIGQGDIGQGDIGQGDIGQGDIGQGDIGQGDIGQGDIGQGDIGRGLFGRGDTDVSGNETTFQEMNPVIAASVEGVAEGEDTPPGPANGLQACLTSDMVPCATRPEDAADASIPVKLTWFVTNLEPAKVAEYNLYRFEYVGETFIAPAPEDLPEEPFDTVPATLGAEMYDYLDFTAPPGKQVAYFVRGRFAPDREIDGTFTATNCEEQGGSVHNDGTTCRFETAISNFDTVTTPDTPAAEAILWVGIDIQGPVQRFSKDGELIGAWGASGASGSALDGAGHVYTVVPGSFQSVITKYDEMEESVAVINFTSGTENGHGNPSWIEDMTYGGNGTLWVSGFNGIVYHIDSTGAVLSQFDTGFTFTGIATDGASLYTTQGFSGSLIHRRDFNGTILSSFDTGVESALGGLAFDASDGTLWVGTFGTIYHFSTTGTLLGSFSTGFGAFHDGLEVGAP